MPTAALSEGNPQQAVFRLFSAINQSDERDLEGVQIEKISVD